VDTVHLLRADVKADVPMDDGSTVSLDLVWDLTGSPLNTSGNDGPIQEEGVPWGTRGGDRCFTSNYLAHQTWRSGAGTSGIMGSVDGLDVSSLFLAPNAPSIGGACSPSSRPNTAAAPRDDHLGSRKARQRAVASGSEGSGMKPEAASEKEGSTMREPEETEVFAEDDPADPSKPGYQQPPGEFVREAQDELGEGATWSQIHARAWELKELEEIEN